MTDPYDKKEENIDKMMLLGSRTMFVGGIFLIVAGLCAIFIITVAVIWFIISL